MKSGIFALAAAVLLAAPALAADPPSPARDPEVKVKPKSSGLSRVFGGSGGDDSLLAPDVDLIDVPTSAVLDYGGYAAKSRFFAGGGLLQHFSFGVFPALNIGASLNIDGIIGNDKIVRARAPNLQLKYRLYDGDRWIPSCAVGYDGQGHYYNQPDKRYNHRQRGFYLVGTQELGLPGLQAHPSFNVSDTNTNSFFGALPLSYNVRDKALLMIEWDNINNFADSRVNAGVRAYVTRAFHVDLAVRAIGQGGRYPNGDRRGPERIVQLGYSGSF